MTIKTRFPSIEPSLDLNFALTRRLDPRITFTRASSGTFVNQNGIVETAAINQARFDHNPTTGESLGLLIEESRTNSIRNNTMVGAVAGAPGTLPTNWSVSNVSGLTQQVVGSGTSGGVAYLDIRFSGTSSGNAININLDTATGIAATNGQSWAFSSYLAFVGGSASNVTGIRFRVALYSSTPTYLGELVATPADLTGGLSSMLVRQAATTGTISNASTAYVQPYIAILVGVGAAIDFTLRIGLPQLEQGAFATSVIPTSNAAATRSADVASITGANFSSWYQQDEGTVFMEAKEYPFVSSASRAFYGFDASATPNTDYIRQWIWSGASGLLLNSVYTSASGPVAAEFTQLLANEQKRVATAVKANDFARSYNGNAAVADASGNLPVGIDRLGIGSTNGSLFVSGHIRRLTYWPLRLSNTILQQLTQ